MILLNEDLQYKNEEQRLKIKELEEEIQKLKDGI